MAKDILDYCRDGCRFWVGELCTIKAPDRCPAVEDEESKFILPTVSCSCCGWTMNAWKVVNLQSVAINAGERYNGKPATHCSWCGKELKAFSSAEG